MKKLFNKIPQKTIANGDRLIAVYPEPTHLITIGRSIADFLKRTTPSGGAERGD